MLLTSADVFSECSLPLSAYLPLSTESGIYCLNNGLRVLAISFGCSAKSSKQYKGKIPIDPLPQQTYPAPEVHLLKPVNTSVSPKSVLPVRFTHRIWVMLKWCASILPSGKKSSLCLSSIFSPTL